LPNCNYAATTKTITISNGNSAPLSLTICNENGVANCTTFSVEKSVHSDNNVLALVNKYIHPLTVCYNLVWQCCSSGTAYNSMSGYVFLVGANCNRILKRVMYSKSCCTYARQKKQKGTTPEGTSKEVLGEQPTNK